MGEEEAERTMKLAAARGTRLHAICEDYLRKQLKPNYDYLTLDLFWSIQKSIDKIDNIRLIEEQMYSEFLGVAGTPDVIADYDGLLSVIDFKSTNNEKKEDWIHDYFMQTAIYAVMFEELTGVPVKQLVIIMAGEDGSANTFIQKRDQWIDMAVDTIEGYYDFYNLPRGPKMLKIPTRLT